MITFQELINFVKFGATTSTVLLMINIILFSFLAVKTKVHLHFIIVMYLLTIFIIQNYGGWLAFKGVHNLFGTHYYFILQLLWLAYFYYKICDSEYQKKIIRFSTLGCLIILAFQYALKPELYYMYNELEIFLCSYLLIIFSLFHFYNKLGTNKKFIFFNIGLFVYMFGSTVLFLLGNLAIFLTLGKITVELNKIMYTLFQLFILTEWIHIVYEFKPIKFKPKLFHGRN